MEKDTTLFVIKGTAEQGTLVRDALCSRHNYREEIEDPEKEGGKIPNPESNTDFAKRKILEYLKNEVIAYRMDAKRLEEAAAKVAAQAEVESLSA